MGDATDRAKKIAGKVATAALLVSVERDDQHNEVASVSFAGIPLFKRDEAGRPKILGIPFRRWARGPRK